MSEPTTDTRTEEPTPTRRRRTVHQKQEMHVLPILVKVVALGLAIGLAAAVTPTLIGLDKWFLLVAIWVITGVLIATYATGRGLPAKYLVPGVLLLVCFVVYPIVLTAQLSTTNYGDGTRGTKDEAIAQIIGSSVKQTPDAPRYNLTVATTGSVTDGPFVFLLVDQSSDEAFVGDAEGLEPLPAATVTDGFVSDASGYTLLTPIQVNDAQQALADFVVPTDGGAIRQLGIREAFEGVTTLRYDEATDTITDTETGTEYTPKLKGDREFFVDAQGERVADQSWQANIGMDNYKRIFTDDRISGDFLRIFVWTLAFAFLSVGTTFLLGLCLAATLSDPRLRGQKVYRAILILPYAIPGFISLLLWASFFNRDFGLINTTLGLDIQWFGNATMAKVAVLLTNLWMGFPYMFLVCTGALTSIPEDLKEAAAIDGASGFAGFRRVTFPLLLVAVAPLLVSSFAFNFNNYNAIFLLTEGGPFTPENPTAGGTDILISYILRLAFGAGGAQIGFASAVSVVLFILTGVIAAIQFRATRALEDVN